MTGKNAASVFPCIFGPFLLTHQSLYRASTNIIPFAHSSLRATALIAGVLGRAGQRGQARRLADAEKGHVAWHNPREIQSFMRQREMTKQGARWTKGDKEDESTEEELRAMLAGTA